MLRHWSNQNNFYDINALRATRCRITFCQLQQVGDLCTDLLTIGSVKNECFNIPPVPKPKEGTRILISFILRGHEFIATEVLRRSGWNGNLASGISATVARGVRRSIVSLRDDRWYCVVYWCSGMVVFSLWHYRTSRNKGDDTISTGRTQHSCIHWHFKGA